MKKVPIDEWLNDQYLARGFLFDFRKDDFPDLDITPAVRTDPGIWEGAEEHSEQHTKFQPIAKKTCGHQPPGRFSHSIPRKWLSVRLDIPSSLML